LPLNENRERQPARLATAQGSSVIACIKTNTQRRPVHSRAVFHLAKRDVKHLTITLGDFHLPAVPAVPVVPIQFVYDLKGIRPSSRVVGQLDSAVILKPATVVDSQIIDRHGRGPPE
jgi:hypothetical protein